MKIEDMLLFYSLKQIHGITAEEEKQLWNTGVTDLQLLFSARNKQLLLFGEDETSKDLIFTIDSLRTGDITHIINAFQKKCDRKDYYRIAYSFPEDVMFLDIETTGLSKDYHYITLIGWFINGKYDFWLPGIDTNKFKTALKNARMIITFNGLKFDCPFIDSLFIDCRINDKPNLDLMYFCRAFEYVGGQKVIEQETCFNRPKELKECDGKEAVALWYEYLFGDNDALDKLLIYNYYDVIGMTYILDFVFFKNVYGHVFPKFGSPVHFFKSELLNLPNFIKLDYSVGRKYVSKEYTKFDINKLSPANNKRIIGIDLAGVINSSSKTGICYLYGKKAITSVVKTDEEILDFIIEHDADIISIDAPLSLPNGRTTVYNDDPKRNEFGIMRNCERVLKQRGINVYPALIDSMQELTKRGILLSRKLRKMGYPVIECFPGAAQDILQIPRKRTDETLLKKGLTRLGIHGDFEDNKVYHDELDAITAALVGQFFISEYYEAIGIPEENYLIVPNVNKYEHVHNIVIGIAGNRNREETEIAKYIQQKYDFTYISYKETTGNKNITVNKENINENPLKETERYLFNHDLENKNKEVKAIIIDGMHEIEDYIYWKELCYNNFFLIYISGKDDRNVKKSEMEKHKDILKEKSDFKISISDNLLQLYNQVDEIFQQLI